MSSTQEQSHPIPTARSRASTSSASVGCHACSRYRPGPKKCEDWIKVKNPAGSASGGRGRLGAQAKERTRR
jgi:hypothetical protein